MKKFKILIDCPWGKAGDIINDTSDLIGFQVGVDSCYDWRFHPSTYHQLFQEIEEVSDEEWLIQWLILNFSSISTNSHQWRPVAKTFILFGFDVNKLREQKCTASTTVCQATECLCVKGVDGEILDKRNSRDVGISKTKSPCSKLGLSSSC